MTNYQRNKKLPRLHYVTQGTTIATHLEQVQRLSQAGCPWIQLRLKNVSQAAYQAAAQQALEICKRQGTFLTINDSVATAVAIQADGIHVGKTDAAPALARTQYPTAIIGATANTWEDVQALANEPIDYIGLGPLRFTTTKEKLSPVLGFEGYRFIINKMQEEGIDIPVLAIGGIVDDDLPLLRQIGVWGIAVSGLLAQSLEPKDLIKKILE